MSSYAVVSTDDDVTKTEMTSVNLAPGLRKEPLAAADLLN